MLLRRRRLVLGVLVASHILTGCYSWKVVAVSPRAFVDSAHVSAIRVEEKGGTKYVLNAPRVAGDSLVGSVKRVFPADQWQPRRVEQSARAIPLAAVYRVAVRKPDSLKLLGLIVSIPIVIIGLFFADVCIFGNPDIEC